MNDIDLEELESQLYSQIYHDTNEENQENSVVPISSLIKSSSFNMKNPNRYFCPWSPHQKFQKSSPGKKNFAKSSPIRNENKDDGRYPTNYEKPYKRDISINQVVVVSPKRPIVCLSRKQLRAEYWREKLKLKRKRQRERKRLEAQRRKQEIEEHRNDEVVQENNEMNTTGQKSNNNTVITLSDSEDDSCVLLENDWPVLSVGDSDDEKCVKNEAKPEFKNEKKISECLSDDVIFVEPVNVPAEVINIDEDSQSGFQQVSLENASSTSNHSSKEVTTEQQLHQERKELLSTPDSASNDFMNNLGIELSEKNFNFSLHGADFNAGVFTKPANPTENCETESSSSTTDVNFVNLMKTVVFNEIEFPKEDIFAGDNLERFESLITPSRSCPSKTVVHSTPIKNSDTQNQNVYSSESSESDFEDTQTDISKSKNLPELSHFHKSPERKRGEQKQEKPKKNKKKKKHSVNENCEIDNKVEEEEKQKKRKSSSLDDNNSEMPIKKKCKNKKKKSDTTSNENDERQIEGSENVCKNSTDLENKEVENECLSVVSNENKEISTCEDGNVENMVKEDIQEKHEDETYNKENSALEGLIIVDEINSDPQAQVVSSDSESILSALNEDVHLQMNTETQKTQNEIFLPFDTEKGCDNFSVKDLQLHMSNDPKMWHILDSDRSPTRRSKGRRCNRCRQFGHIVLHCHQKKYPKCQLCGEGGHYEPRCPNKLCTQCGQKSNYLTNYCSSCFKYRRERCHVCSMVGHPADKCPDLWRRYYLTTTEGPLKSYDGPVQKKKEQLWCSGCACNGHLEHECQFFKSLYPPSNPYIRCLDDVYQECQDRPEESASNRTQQEQQQNFRPNPFNINNHQNYRMNAIPNVNPNILLPQNCQRYQNNNFSNNYYNPNFGFMNNQFGNLNANLMQLANQNLFTAFQNYFPFTQNNLMNPTQNFQHFPNQVTPNATQNSQQHSFDKPLPTFISLETNVPESSAYKDVDQLDTAGKRYFKRDKQMLPKRLNSIFFSSPTVELQHFINEELQVLSKLSVVATKVVKELRKKRVPGRGHARAEHYRTLNMCLFGVFNFLEGKMHLDRLKQYKLERNKNKVTQTTRRQLLKSFLYIFGQEPHEGVSYMNLLSRF